MSEDYLIRAIDDKQMFRMFAARTNNLVEEARRRHDTWPVATAALGRALTGALLLAANLKGDDLLTLRIVGDGPLGGIIVSADAHGNVRGYVIEPHVDLPRIQPGKLPVGAAVGKGMLYVSRDLGLKEPFTGSVELVSGEIAEDLAYYLTRSEQTPSAVALGVLVGPDNTVQSAGGYWIEVLPGASEEALGQIENKLQVVPPVSEMLARGATPEDLVTTILGEGWHLLAHKPLAFRCRCSQEKVEEVVAGLGREELQRIAEGGEDLEVRCHFCSKVYHLPAARVKELLAELEG